MDITLKHILINISMTNYYERGTQISYVYDRSIKLSIPENCTLSRLTSNDPNVPLFSSRQFFIICLNSCVPSSAPTDSSLSRCLCCDRNAMQRQYEQMLLQIRQCKFKIKIYTVTDNAKDIHVPYMYTASIHILSHTFFTGGIMFFV